MAQTRARLRAMRFGWLFMACCVVGLALPAATGVAQSDTPSSTVLDIRFTPTKRAQIAIWIEDADGRFLTTLLLTELTARRGIGNRPGASQMNSGYRWPYGRREGVLPIWGTRRASAPDAKQFKRVIFQNRYSEGRASQTRADQSPDPYYCLSFDPAASNKDSLDAVSCASARGFSSDKGRFITEDDVAGAYAEPFEDPETRTGEMVPLSLHSLYPPRWDATRCTTPTTCVDHPDMTEYRRHVLDVIPNIDAIASATLQAETEQHELFTVPDSWPRGQYTLWLEINVEGDYNDVYNDETFATPTTPATNGVGVERVWDHWATDFGYPYRGQPSVVYRVPFMLGESVVMESSTAEPVGAGGWDYRDELFGQLGALDTITDDPEGAPGSGADRLRRHPDDDARLHVTVRPPTVCEGNTAPTAVADLQVTQYEDFRHRHEWAQLSFATASDDERIAGYEVRFSESEMVDADTFLTLGEPAKSATSFSQELMIPVSDDDAVTVDFGGMAPSTTYFLGVRAIDTCNAPGELTFTTFTTSEQKFTTVTPCFVATAAYGSPLAHEIGSLRRLRDRFLATNALGRALIDVYYDVGPTLASFIVDHAWLRRATQHVLAPLVWLSSLLDSEP